MTEAPLHEQLWNAAYNASGIERLRELLKEEIFKNKQNLEIKSNNEWKCSPLWIACYSMEQDHPFIFAKMTETFFSLDFSGQ